MYCKNKKIDLKHKITDLEQKHIQNVNRTYMLYSVLRDLYKRDKKKKIQEKTIAERIAKQFTVQDYIYNKNILEESYIVASDLLSLSKKNNKEACLSIKDNMKYIKRVIDMFREIIINHHLGKLKYEMKLEYNDIKEIEKDFNSLP